MVPQPAMCPSTPQDPAPPRPAPLAGASSLPLRRTASAGLVGVLLLVLASQGAWTGNVVALAPFAVETSEEEVTTPTTIERVRQRRQQGADPSPPSWAVSRLDAAHPPGLAWKSEPVVVDSRSGRQRVYLLRHLLI